MRFLSASQSFAFWGGKHSFADRHHSSKTGAVWLGIGALAWTICGVCAQSFEEEAGYERGAAIETFEGWSSSAEAIAEVSEKEFANGSQSLAITKHSEGDFVEFSYVPAADGITFVDFWIRPSVEVDEPKVAVEVDGAMIGFLSTEKKTAEVVGVVPDANGELGSRSTGREFAMKPKGEASEWVRLTLRRDRVDESWDIFVNGELALADLPARNAEVSTLRFYAGPDPVYVDEVGVHETNILFPDEDKDGLSDVYEKTFGLNPRFNDRLADRDLDGISNLEEYLAGTRPDVRAGTTAGRVIYVDNIYGSDANTGEAPQAFAGAAAPKLRLREAMEEARDGDTIMVLRGTETYRIGEEPLPGGDFTIRFEAENTIIKE